MGIGSKACRLVMNNTAANGSDAQWRGKNGFDDVVIFL